MKKVIILTALLASAAWAVDYSQISTEALMNMRGTISVNEQPAFRAEMQKRMQTMTPTQRQELMQRPAKAQGMGKGMNSQRGQGMSKGINKNKGKGKQNRPDFASYDLNRDGKVSKKEFYDAQAARMTQKANEGKMMRKAGNAPTFESIDTNSDGVVTTTEFSTQQTKRMNSNTSGGGQGKGMGASQAPQQ